MSGGSAMHIEILNPGQRDVLEKLGTLPLKGYYLAGGTALALQMGHRLSLDFDLFTSHMGDPEQLLSVLNSSGMEYRVLSTGRETLHINAQGIPVSFFGYDYPLLAELISTGSIACASPDDIACMKLSAIASRGSRKDFVDLYCILTHYRGLGDYLRLYTEKYRSRDIGHLLRSLVYFEDAESEPELRMLRPVQWETLKSRMEEWVIAASPVVAGPA